MYKQRPCFIKSVEATVDYVDIDDQFIEWRKGYFEPAYPQNL